MTHIPFKVSLLRLVFLLLPVTVAAQEARLSDYVDPRIGSEGLGRVFIGPSCPYHAFWQRYGSAQSYRLSQR